jgi:HEAT repeat protein
MRRLQPGNPRHGGRFSGFSRLASLAFVNAVLATLWGAWPSAGQGPSGDAVEALRQVLQAPVRDPVARAKDLQECARGLRGVNDLRRAVQLMEWRDEDPDEKIAAADRPQREAIARRFEAAVRDVLRQPDATVRLAAVNMLAELGVKGRGVQTRFGLARAFAADLVRLTQQEDASVRQAAARALGQILADPKVATPALSHLLEAPDTADRQAAAEGFVNLVRVLEQLSTRSRTVNGVEVTRDDVVQAGKVVLPAVARGADAADARVRRLCVESIGRTAATLAKLVSDAQLPEERAERAEYRKGVQEELAALKPLIVALREQGPVLVRALTDADSQVRLFARLALEDGDVANNRLRALRRAAAPDADEMPGRRFTFTSNPNLDEPLVEGLQARVEALAAAVGDGDVRARRAAIDVLEMFGTAAAPAAQALVGALADPDHFVRWAAARTLGKIGPAEADAAVPALVRLLDDADLDVRLAATTALERYGRTAGAAAPALTKCAAAGDVELRVAAMRALQAIGEEAQAAVGVLAAALADPDSRVRRAAAETLGRIGPAAREAVEPLRKALTDGDAEVRRAAGAALLAIVDPTQR